MAKWSAHIGPASFSASLSLLAISVPELMSCHAKDLSREAKEASTCNLDSNEDSYSQLMITGPAPWRVLVSKKIIVHRPS